MKKNTFLWIIPLTFLTQLLQAQPVKNFRKNPSVQLYRLVQVAEIVPPKINMPSISPISNQMTPIGFDIAKTITDARSNCSSLFFKSTIQLNGERNSNEKVGLEWKTTYSFDDRGFDVERSLGDTLNFENVNFVWAKYGRIKNKYELPDNNDYTDVSYYRIRQWMDDGSYKYSNTISVKGYDKFLFKVYPNPSSTKVQINLSSIEAGMAIITLYDGNGKSVHQYSPQLQKGNNLSHLDITALPAGVYTIKVILPNKQIRSGEIIKN